MFFTTSRWQHPVIGMVFGNASLNNRHFRNTKIAIMIEDSRATTNVIIWYAGGCSVIASAACSSGVNHSRSGQVPGYSLHLKILEL